MYFACVGGALSQDLVNKSLAVTKAFRFDSSALQECQ